VYMRHEQMRLQQKQRLYLLTFAPEQDKMSYVHVTSTHVCGELERTKTNPFNKQQLREARRRVGKKNRNVERPVNVVRWRRLRTSSPRTFIDVQRRETHGNPVRLGVVRRRRNQGGTQAHATRLRYNGRCERGR